MAQYQMPITPVEAPFLFPAIATAAQNKGLTTYSRPNQVEVHLEDGTVLHWNINQDNQAVLLWVSVASKDVNAAKQNAAKHRADEIWAAALELRRQNPVSVVVVAPAGTAPVAVPPGTQPCRFETDCPHEQVCRDWGNNRYCMGNGVQGAACVFETDCGVGLFCRGDRFQTCQR
jgi:hypothetical protein